MSWGKHRIAQHFSVPIQKAVANVGKDGNESVVPIILQNKIY